MFDIQNFMPHGHCFLWKPGILWTHVLSDGLIALSYFSIPLALAMYVKRKKATSLEFRAVIWMFAAFICLCGITHTISIWTMWNPQYYLEGLSKALTAFVSVVTALKLWSLIPFALKIPSPDDLARVNKKLEEANSFLEQRVSEATKLSEQRAKETEQANSLLKKSNEELKDALQRTRDAESKEKQSKERMRALLDNSRNFIGLMSPCGILLDANKAALNASGVRPEDVVGKFFWDTLWWSHSNELQERLKKAIAMARNGKKDEFEAEHLAPDGSTIYVDISISPIFDSNEVVGLVPEGIDVTEVKQREKEILNYSKSLERINRELQRSNSELDDFTYIVSHDLKSPLRAINNIAQWIEEDCQKILPSESLEDLRKLRVRVDRMNSLLDGLLQYSRVGRADDDLCEVNLNQMVGEIIEMIDKPQAFKITVEGILPKFRTVYTPLNVVVRNLINNAIKHRTDDDSNVWINGSEDGKSVTISIKDDGPGIPENQHQKIFGLFKTLKSGDMNGAGGLGLAIVKKSVENIGGSIVVKNNNEGKGVTFIVKWPKK